MRTKTGKTVKCSLCKKEFYIYLARERQSKHKKHFCSLKCASKYRVRENHPRWIGGCVSDGHGYNQIRIDGDYILEHRHVMEKHLGRKLLVEEHIHHINGIKTDNRIENLQILSSSEHAKITLTIDRWAKKFDKCIECSRTSVKHVGKGLCIACYSKKNYWKRRAKKNKS